MNLLFNQAFSLHQQGQWAQARAIYDRLLKSDPNHFDAWHLLGVLEFQSQNPGKALECITRALQIQPLDVGAHLNLGLVWADLGQLDQALKSHEQALALNPELAEAHYNRGNVCMRLKQPEEAQASFKKAIALRPQHVASHYNLGIALRELNRLEEAARAYEKALDLQPDYAPAHANLGDALYAMGRLSDALSCCDRALALNPEFAVAHSNRGNALFWLSRTDEAIIAYQQAIKLDPQYAEAHFNLGNAWLKKGEPRQALSCYEVALHHRPLHADTLCNQGEAWRDLGDSGRALACYQRAIEIDPCHAESYVNSGNASIDLGRHDLALQHYCKALALDPTLAKAHWNLGLHRLSHRVWEAGWQGYGYRRDMPDVASIAWHAGVRRWEGGRPEGRVLVVAEQGIGDEVFLSKALALFARREVVPACVTVDERLVAIFRRSYPGWRFEARAQVQSLNAGDFDVQMALGDVASYLALDPGREPELSGPHLVADEVRVGVLKRSVEGRQRLRVGVSWKSKNAKLGAEKSMTLLQVMSAMRGLDVEWINLQYGAVSEEIAEVERVLGVVVRQVPGVDVTQDLDGWLGLIAGCDAVLTSSNSTAHFAGAVGKAGVVVVPFGKGKLWYWHLEDGPSPWYGSLQVVHAKALNAWEPALEQARQWLESHPESAHSA